MGGWGGGGRTFAPLPRYYPKCLRPQVIGTILPESKTTFVDPSFFGIAAFGSLPSLARRWFERTISKKSNWIRGGTLVALGTRLAIHTVYIYIYLGPSRVSCAESSSTIRRPTGNTALTDTTQHSVSHDEHSNSALLEKNMQEGWSSCVSVLGFDCSPLSIDFGICTVYIHVFLFCCPCYVLQCTVCIMYL